MRAPTNRDATTPKITIDPNIENQFGESDAAPCSIFAPKTIMQMPAPIPARPIKSFRFTVMNCFVVSSR
jgi:hypothetical protein